MMQSEHTAPCPATSSVFLIFFGIPGLNWLKASLRRWIHWSTTSGKAVKTGHQTYKNNFPALFYHYATR
ncbi:hypothetical protein ACE6ZO_004403 [Salmonella enterica]